MPKATRTFRVFISSTFEDLKLERNALQRDVFPKLEKLCLEKGARFQAVDLRWGVREEAGLDHRTMDICKAEIARCKKTGIKPNFIVLLGDRYGWRPLPASINEREFQKVLAKISEADRLKVEAWYDQVDNNALPPQRVLKPRDGVHEDRHAWAPVEEELHQILRDAAHKAGLPEQDLIKYDASATHQEILAGLEKPEDREHVFGFLRAPNENPLRDLLPKENVHKFAAGDLTTLCKDVERVLRGVIETEVAGFESIKPLQQEKDAHERFAKERSSHFVGRADVLEAIKGYLTGDERRPLVVHGPSGSGKSSILAKSSLDHPGIRRFIGATPSSSSGLTLLQSLCEELGERYGQTRDVPATFNELAVMFQDRLRLATPDLPLILYLDALDQLNPQDPAVDMNWLPRPLPPNCRVVFSTIDIPVALSDAKPVPVAPFSQDEAGATLKLWLSDAKRTLQDDQREKLLTSFQQTGLPLYLKLAFEEARLWRSFDPLDKCVLVNGLPGIIDRLFSRLKLDANHGKVLVDHALGYLTAARYGLAEDEILAVLAANDVVWTDFERTKKHDLPQEMLAEDGKATRRLPPILWSRLYLDLEPYLTERSVPGGITVSFYHQQLAQRVSRDKTHHAALAEYFGKQSHWLDAEKPNQRKITELVRQQVGAELLDEAQKTLTDLDFVSAKCAAELVFDLQEDYREVIAVLPEAQEIAQQRAVRICWAQVLIECALAQRMPKPEETIKSIQPWTLERISAEENRIVENPTWLDRLRQFSGFVEQELYSLQRFGQWPGFVIQQAFNQAPTGLVRSAAQALLSDSINLLRIWPSSAVYHPRLACLRTLEGHRGHIDTVSLAADGRQVVSGGQDNAVRVWDVETGACIRTLEGHQDFVNSVSVTADSRLVVSGGKDRMLRVWDIEKGLCLRTLMGHTDEVSSVSVTADGRIAVSGGKDRALRVWGIEKSICLRTLTGHADEVSSVSVAADGRIAISSGNDRTLRVWDIETGLCLRTLRDYECYVTCVGMTPDGRLAVSGCGDGTLRVWDLDKAVCLRILEGHTREVSSVSVSADGRLAVSGCGDGTLRVWDLESGASLRELSGHAWFVTNVGVTSDGRRAVSGSWDNTVRIWDLETGGCQESVDRHGREVRTVIVDKRGQRAITAGDRVIRVWDPQTGACLRILEGHDDEVMTMSMMLDGRRAVSAGAGTTLRVWDLESGACLNTLEGHSSGVERVSVTPDRRRAISASWDTTLRVWDLEKGICHRTLEGHQDKVMWVQVTPDGHRAVSASADAMLRVWDLELGSCLNTLKGHKGSVNSVSVTPDGRRAISTSSDATLRVWDLETGMCLNTLAGHTDVVDWISVTPDGRRAVSASWDGTLRVWDLATGNCLKTLAGFDPSWLESVSVTPDGRRAVSAGSNQTLRVWDLEQGGCLAFARLNAPCSAVAITHNNRIVAGTSTGEVVFFDLHLPQ